MAETYAQYYEVLAENKNQARERAYAYNQDKSWAVDSWDNGVNDQLYVDIEEV